MQTITHCPSPSLALFFTPLSPAPFFEPDRPARDRRQGWLVLAQRKASVDSRDDRGADASGPPHEAAEKDPDEGE